MNIGTAKPTRDEQKLVPHHFIDVASPDQDWSLAVYLPRAIAVIEEIQQRGNLPFLVGGTGQYIQAIVQGWDLPSIKPDPGLREELRQWAEQIGVDGIRARLEELDPEAAAGIDGPNLLFNPKEGTWFFVSDFANRSYPTQRRIVSEDRPKN